MRHRQCPLDLEHLPLFPDEIGPLGGQVVLPPCSFCCGLPRRGAGGLGGRARREASSRDLLPEGAAGGARLGTSKVAPTSFSVKPLAGGFGLGHKAVVEQRGQYPSDDRPQDVQPRAREV